MELVSFEALIINMPAFLILSCLPECASCSQMRMRTLSGQQEKDGGLFWKNFSVFGLVIRGKDSHEQGVVISLLVPLHI